MPVQDAFAEIFGPIKRTLVVLAHPDDMEINCGGIITRLTALKKAVRIVITTNGSKGTKEKSIDEKTFAKQRISEQLEAGKILGVPKSENFNLEIPDGELEATIQNIEKVVFHIRQFKPDIVITHNSTDPIINFSGRSHWINHRDHRHTGIITLDAVYPYSRDRGFFPLHFSQHHLSPHTVSQVLVTDSYTKAEVKYFDISDFLKQKKRALQKHLSAFDPADADDYLDENKLADGYFEPLAYYKVY